MEIEIEIEIEIESLSSVAPGKRNVGGQGEYETENE